MATIGIHYVNAALQGARKRGQQPEELLLAAGIQPALTAEPDARVHADQMTHLVQLIWQRLGDEFMGFVEPACKNGVFALMAETVSHCSNLEGLLRRGIHFYNLFSDGIVMELQHSGELCQIDIRFTRPELDPQQFYREFWLVIWHRFPSWYIGESIHLSAVELDYPAPQYEAELRHIFPCQLHFSQPSCKLVFQRSYLNKPLIRSPLELEQFLTNSPADLMTIPGEDHSLSAQIHRMIVKDSRDTLHFPKIEVLAQMLKISPQTLHRRLIADGTSYQQIKNHIRRDLAISKLVKEQCSVEEVSRIAGFSEPSSFTRAFKQWTGMSPRDYRKRD
ncbi:MAG: AraC family transcriptional regulator [Porticoccaceae bacterium]|nr:AraC family transcriptional regulator [Porticoccaceae bacterium]